MGVWWRPPSEPNPSKVKGVKGAGLRDYPGRGKKPVWRELTCKSLKEGMLELTFPRSSSIPAQQAEMVQCLFAPCQHILLLMVQW